MGRLDIVAMTLEYNSENIFFLVTNKYVRKKKNIKATFQGLVSCSSFLAMTIIYMLRTNRFVKRQ